MTDRKLDPARVVALWRNGWTARQIAKEEGVSAPTVYDALRRQGITPGRQPTETQEAALRAAGHAAREAQAKAQTARLRVREALAAGNGPSAVAARTGLDRKTVLRIRREMMAEAQS